jgi:ferredoxin
VVCEEVCPTSPKAIHSEYKKLLIREGKKQIHSATPVAATLIDPPGPGESFGERSTFKPGQFAGDQTTSYYVQIIHKDGVMEMHRILDNGPDTLLIGRRDPQTGDLMEGARFARQPERGAIAAIHIEFRVPKVDTALCIGCGLCEKECPVAGDRRAVYVTAEGETRSEDYQSSERNRSLRLLK